MNNPDMLGGALCLGSFVVAMGLGGIGFVGALLAQDAEIAKWRKILRETKEAVESRKLGILK